MVVEEEGIFDPITGELVELPEGAQVKVAKLQEPVVVDDDPILDPSQGRVADPMKDLRDLEVKQQPKAERPNVLEVQDWGRSRSPLRTSGRSSGSTATSRR